MSVYLEEMLSGWDQQERNKVNENWRRIMATFTNLQRQINILAGGEEVNELLQRLNDAVDSATIAVQEAIDANNTATQDAITENNTALQIALDKVADKLLEVNQAIENADTSAEGANAAKQGALDATEQAQTAISSMRSLIDNTVHRGIWNNTTQYFKNNMATYNGSAFIALQDNVDKTPPTLPTQSNAYWSLFAEKGGTGATGPEGRPGKDGKDGTGVNIIGSLASEAELPQTGSPGDAYMIGGDLYVWQANLNNWKNVGPIQGPEGKSAYDLAVQNGFVGTMEEWLESLKGGIGPPGPDGPQGPPGKDADLTEVNQEIANIKQTVTDNKTEVTEHLGQDVLSEDGAHGIRYFNGELSVKNDEDQWEVVETGGAEMYQNYVMREEMSNALGSNTFSQSTTFASIVNSVDAANNKLTLWNTEGISVSDAVKLKRNDSVILEDATVIAISGQVITISTLATLDTSITHVFKLGGSKTNQNAEGLKTVSSGSNSHAEGLSTVAFGDNSHAEGMETYTSGTASHAEGRFTKATGFAAHAEGLGTKATGNRAHAEGAYTEAIGDDSHAEGQGSKAAGAYSHSEGSYTEATGAYSHAEGQVTVAIGEASHAEGYKTRAEGHYSHTEGSNTKATANSAHAEGYLTEATGNYSHAEGNRTKAKGEYSHSSGDTTTADVYASTAIGRYNKVMSGSHSLAVATDDAFVIGNGTSPTSLSNALRVRFNGNTYGMGAWNSTGADYAEFFEWLDGNVDNEDRVGFVVALDGDKIRKATADDTYLLGIISANPSVIGDSHQDDWNNKFVTDEWGRIQYHWVDVEYEELITVQTEDGVHNETIIKTRQDYVPILNPDWNNDEEYTPREQRKEWDTVGLIGKLLVRDDGTCEVNSYAKVGAEEGMLTASNERTDMRVIERVAPNIVRVFIK